MWKAESDGAGKAARASRVSTAAGSEQAQQRKSRSGSITGSEPASQRKSRASTAEQAAQRASMSVTAAEQASQRRVSKQAMQRRRSTALNIASTLDAMKERQVLCQRHGYVHNFPPSAEIFVKFLNRYSEHTSRTTKQQNLGMLLFAAN